MIDDRYGLNKAARLKAKREKAEAEARAVPVAPLDTPFPYETAAFDAGFFGVELSGPSLRKDGAG